MATLSQNITQAISDLSSIKTALEAQGVSVPANTPSSQYSTLIESISGDDSTLKAMVDGSITDLTIPDGTTSIRNQFMYKVTGLSSVTIPNSVLTIGYEAFYQCNTLSNLTMSNAVTSIDGRSFLQTAITSLSLPSTLASVGSQAFQECTHLQSLTIANGLTTIGTNAFRYCSSLESAVLPNSVSSIGSYAFYDCSSMETLHIPGSVQTIGYGAFDDCSNLINVTLGNGFNADGLRLESSTRCTAATIVGWLNALADRTGQTAYTLIIGSTNLYKLTAAEIAIATNKNWNLS